MDTTTFFISGSCDLNLWVTMGRIIVFAGVCMGRYGCNNLFYKWFVRFESMGNYG